MYIKSSFSPHFVKLLQCCALFPNFCWDLQWCTIYFICNMLWKIILYCIIKFMFLLEHCIAHFVNNSRSMILQIIVLFQCINSACLYFLHPGFLIRNLLFYFICSRCIVHYFISSWTMFSCFKCSDFFFQTYLGTL